MTDDKLIEQSEKAELDAHRSARAANLFDVRRFIGGLFVLYGVILLVMGIGASDADVEQAAKTLQLVEGTARAARRAIPARVVPSRLKHATAVSRHAVGELDAAALPRTDAGIGDRVAFAEMTFSGRVPAAGDAGQEIAALVAELRGFGWLPAAARAKATIARG